MFLSVFPKSILKYVVSALTFKELKALKKLCSTLPHSGSTCSSACLAGKTDGILRRRLMLNIQVLAILLEMCSGLRTSHREVLKQPL